MLAFNRQTKGPRKRSFLYSSLYLLGHWPILTFYDILELLHLNFARQTLFTKSEESNGRKLLAKEML